MTRWWTSDPHFGHGNIIRYCGRPFPDVAAMDRALVGRWNEVVAPGDEVMVLGDVAMGPREQTLRLVAALHGAKTLVPGNHDRCWSGHGAVAASWVGAYLDAGFERVLDGPLTDTVAGVAVLVDHFPYRGDSHDEDRYGAHRPVDGGAWLLHGHVHGRWRQSDRQINVGVDAWDGRPVADDEIAALIAAGPGELAAAMWRPDRPASR